MAKIKIQEDMVMKYEIKGDNLPVVVCELNDGETMRTESGSMSWMSPNMEMTTSGGGIGKMFGRLFSGESMFQNLYTAHGQGVIAFSASSCTHSLGTGTGSISGGRTTSQARSPW